MEAVAAVLRDPRGPFTIETLQVDDPQAGEVQVEVHATGLCHTDLLSRDFPPERFPGPSVYGHEGAGVVRAVGHGVSSIAPGDHVVMSYDFCGTCPRCTSGRMPYCDDFVRRNNRGSRADGTTAFTDAGGRPVRSHHFGQSSFASVTVVAVSSIVKIDPTLDLRRLGPLGCGIQTGAGAILRSLRVPAGGSVVITGAGAVGLSAVMAAAMVGAGSIVAADRHPDRLALARRFGATHTVTAGEDLAARVREITARGTDYAFDTTGNAAVIRAAFDSLSKVGTLGLAGVGLGDLTFDALSMISGRTIRGIVEGDAIAAELVPWLAARNQAGELPYDELITEFSIDDINDAEHASLTGEVVKPVLLFDHST